MIDVRKWIDTFKTACKIIPAIVATASALSTLVPDDSSHWVVMEIHQILDILALNNHHHGPDESPGCLIEL